MVRSGRFIGNPGFARGGLWRLETLKCRALDRLGNSGYLGLTVVTHDFALAKYIGP